jgi:hypothetical protein
MKVTLTMWQEMHMSSKELADKSVLNILQPKHVKNAFNEKDERENRLFQLFLLNPLWEAILIWTDEKPVSTGKNTITIKKLMAYVGLELAMSLIQIGSISKYWERQPPQNWDASNAATAITCTASMCFIIVTSTRTSLTLG